MPPRDWFEVPRDWFEVGLQWVPLEVAQQNVFAPSINISAAYGP